MHQNVVICGLITSFVEGVLSYFKVDSQAKQEHGQKLD